MARKSRADKEAFREQVLVLAARGMDVGSIAAATGASERSVRGVLSWARRAEAAARGEIVEDQAEYEARPQPEVDFGAARSEYFEHRRRCGCSPLEGEFLGPECEAVWERYQAAWLRRGGR